MTERSLIAATLERSIPLTADTKHLFFRTAMPQFAFAPGQFVSIVAPKEDGKPITRAYSIASPPRGDNTFDLCLNRVQDGFMSNRLCTLPEGSPISWHGPHGLFTLKQPVRSAIFIATGTGIAPFRSMLHWLYADPSRHRDREFWLVFGMRYASDLYYREEFERLEREHANFHYVVTLSRAGEDWKGRRGYVQEHVREIAAGRTDLNAYICGLNAMVAANREQLAQLGWEKKSVIFERYD